jgi:hypothetical protein
VRVVQDLAISQDLDPHYGGRRLQIHEIYGTAHECRNALLKAKALHRIELPRCKEGHVDVASRQLLARRDGAEDVDRLHVRYLGNDL